MSRYGTFSDDYYVNMNLNTEMELPSGRETILHFFEHVQKKYPSMHNFYSRDRNEFVLEEEKDRGSYRWTTIEPRRVLSGHVNPTSLEDAMSQHSLVLELVPYFLSVSPLDCESLNLMYGFDYTYRGNHNELVTEVLGMVPAYEKLVDTPGTTMISYEPTIQFTKDEDCRMQGRLSIETRTSAYQIRNRDFPEEQFSVYLTGRRYGSLEGDETFVTALDKLADFCQDLLDNHIVDHVLRPLQQAIAIK